MGNFLNSNTDVLLIVTAALLGALVIAMTVMAVLLARSRREMNETRRETAETIDRNFDTINSSLMGSSAQTFNQLELIRGTMDRRLEAMQRDNAGQLERMRATVDEKLQTTLEERISRSFEQVRSSLDEVYKGLGEMQGLAQGVGDLKKVLTNVKSRGILGEIQLGAILSQILAPGQYEENVATVPGSSERVEFAVVMPGTGGERVLLPIDSKFPGDAYANLMVAYDDGNVPAVLECRKILIQQFKKEAKDIQTKYIFSPYTTDFAVMFLPFEGLYAEAVNLGVLETLQRENHVMIAGPSTMSALLNSLQMGFRTLAIQKNAGRVWKVLGNVKTEFDKFEEVLAQAQSRINQANQELDKLVGTRTRMIQKTLKDIQELGPEGPEKEL